MSDPRFTRLKTDPRFRRPKVKRTRVVIDERFKAVFDQGKTKNGARVDKYGRPVSASEQGENLRRYYRLENDDEDENSSLPKRPDLARGEVVLESSDEDEVKQTTVSDQEDSEEDGGFVTLGADPSCPVSAREEEGFLEVDLDEADYADLDLQAESYSQAYAKQEKEKESKAGKGEGETTRSSRLAIVNLDWDHVRAQHLYKICSSLVSPSAPSTSYSVRNPSSPSSVLALPDPDINYERQKGASKGTPHASHAHPRVVRGQVRSVRVYPSEFGRSRMEREEREGPPKEIFKKKDEKEVNARTVYDFADGEEGEYDVDALRRYQLERLRYYYAIVECDTVQAATHIYNELEGTELERSANVFDVSFVPEGMTFEGEPRDGATGDLNTEYKPVEFVTDALRHSKVKLTWDDDDPERHYVTRRALTKREIEEGDFGNYVAGSSAESTSDSQDEGRRPNKKGKGKKGKEDRKVERDKLRALLLGGNGDEMPEGWGADDYGYENDNDDPGDVDMEITFMPALTKKVGEEDETTLERYQRKVKEKRRRRKEERVTSDEVEKEGRDAFFEASGRESDGSGREEVAETSRDKSRKGKKGHRRGKEGDTVDESHRKEATATELALLVASDEPTDEPKHFNIKSVIKAEKIKKRKGKRKGKKGRMDGQGEDNEAQEGFVMNVKDERFKALFEDHQFAVDPSNPQFKKTKAMTDILEERQRRRRAQVEDAEEVKTTVSRRGRPALDNSSSGADSKSLQSLVESLKRKSANTDLPGIGKRRKL